MNISAKYSILIAGEYVDRNEIKTLLRAGLKLIIFTNEQTKNEIKKENEAFVKADFLNVYINPNKINIIIKDGIIENDDILRLLEQGDTSFNMEQYQIEHEPSSRNLIVKAGAGTGKTHVMINRILYLMHVDSDFNFSKVAMITFTNKATDNMRHKLIEKINDKYRLTGNEKYLDKVEELSRISISTIHSFFKKVVIEVGAILGYGTNIQLKSYILEKKELLRDLLNNQYKGNRRVEDVIGLSIHQIEELALQYWEKLDNNGISKEEILNLNWGNTDDQKALLIQRSLIQIFHQVDEEYNRIKYINNAISMKDIIHELSRVIDTPEFKDYINNNYKYMFCDEFQDSDNVQIHTISILNRVYHGNLFVVGDIKQSIYRFRGATDSAFIKLEELMTEEEKNRLVVRSLTKNYRTSGDVLNELDSIFMTWGSRGLGLLQYEHTTEKSDKLIPQKRDSGCYYQISIKHGEREKKTIETIKSIQSKSKHKKITCLARKNSQLKKIKEWCEKEKIVCLVKEIGSFYTSDAVLDFCALIEAYLFDNEPMYLYNFIMSSYGTGRVKFDELRECDGNKFKIFSCLLSEIEAGVWERNRQDLRNKPVMAVLRGMISDMDPIKNYGLRRKSELLAKNYPEDNAIKQAVLDTTQYEANLKKLLQILTDQFSGDFSSLLDVCEFVRLKIMTDRNEEPAEIETIGDINYVEGLTVHASKGLEFENVLIPFMNDSFYQRFRSEILVSRDRKNVGWVYRKNSNHEIKNKFYEKLIKEEDVEVAKEETRLLYVAMTRTIYGLYCFPERNSESNGKPMSWADLLPKERDNARDI